MLSETRYTYVSPQKARSFLDLADPLEPLPSAGERSTIGVYTMTRARSGKYKISERGGLRNLPKRPRRNPRGRLTKREVEGIFREEFMPVVRKQEAKWGRGRDRVYRYEMWSGFTDALCKDGEITMDQYENWSTPSWL